MKTQLTICNIQSSGSTFPDQTEPEYLAGAEHDQPDVPHGAQHGGAQPAGEEVLQTRQLLY